MCLYIVIYIQVSMYYMGLYIGSLYSRLYYICYAQSTDSDHPTILLPKPRIRALRNNPRITHANLGSEDVASQTSDPHANVGSLQRIADLLCVRDRSWLLLCRGWPNCFACTIDRGFVDADGRAALRARSIVCLLPRMAEVWLRVDADGRGLVVRSQKIACGSEFCAAKSCFACAIDRGFVAADGRGLVA